ncbi:calcium-binding EF-hand family protein isoform X2 [Wolffia australiana]
MARPVRHRSVASSSSDERIDRLQTTTDIFLLQRPPPRPVLRGGEGRMTSSQGWATLSASFLGENRGRGARSGIRVVLDRHWMKNLDFCWKKISLSQGDLTFSRRTVRLLMFLFSNPRFPSVVGPNEFAAIWSCVGQWRVAFERFDRDRSGEIDSGELRNAMLFLGYAVPDSVIRALISRYEGRSHPRGALNFDNFVECGIIVKGLTERFKEKDPQRTGFAKLTYDDYMSMVIPFIVP